MVIEFTVDGVPKAQPRHRAAIRGGRVVVYDPETAAAWREAVMLAAKPHLPKKPLDCPIVVHMDLRFPRRKSAPKRDIDRLLPHVTKPDVDNAIKSTFDALTACGLWRDDALIYALHYTAWTVDLRGERRPGMTMLIDGKEDWT